ncbi:MAG: tRNA (adenosine(37)-N6)-threonylcarbamoyltransferase complex ATPase subunit type 1 TsaE [Pseudomonadota bacterium]|nr:tRNA (adenosine(37)-N6)-threonylcarbamoyltransferase complex ATPase subunit type 1 TsaE [Pseudomonadota bacterium]
MVTLTVADDPAMRALGARLALACPPSCVIYLVGELGAGKSTLARGFLRALGHVGTARSPTYTLVEPYELPERQIYHLDLYRLADPEELEFLGLRDWLAEDAILLVEWPQRGEGLLPAADLTVTLLYVGKARLVTLQATSAKGAEVVAVLAQ